MDFLTNITLSLMPIVQDPFFKKGCYGFAIITMIILIFLTIRMVIKRRKEKEGRIISDRSSPGVTFISILFFISLSIGILADITEWNEPGKITVLDSGEVISTPKPYFALGKKKTAVYDHIKEIKSTDVDDSPQPVDMKFNDSGIAQADYKFNLKLPEDPVNIIAIHEKFGSQEKLINEGAKPLIQEAIKIGAMLLCSEESSDMKEKKLAAFVNDQLKKGLYLIERGTILKDKDGNLIRKKHYFSEFKVRFEKFKLENFNKEDIVMKIEIEKEKITKELEKINLLKLKEIPFINDLEVLIEHKIMHEKSISKDQKELIISSLKSAKKMLLKLRERKPDSRDRRKNSDTL